MSLEERWALTDAGSDDQQILRNAQRIRSGDATLRVEEVVIFDEARDQFFLAYVNFFVDDSVYGNSSYIHPQGFIRLIDGYRWW